MKDALNEAARITRMKFIPYGNDEVYFLFYFCSVFVGYVYFSEVGYGRRN